MLRKAALCNAMPSIRAILPDDSFNRNLVAVLLVLWCVSCFRLPSPKYFAMQHVPTVIAVIGLVAIDKRFEVDRLSYTCFIFFLLLHVLGARYLYSYVPYDDWSQWLLGIRITDYFGFERNHYDRLVHFAFGLLMIYPLWQVLESHLPRGRLWPAAAAVCIVLAASAVYEIIEWSMAMTFAPDWAEAYNGQQGDVWDPQRDMALATGGAAIGVGLVGAFHKSPIRTP
jgi:putative membrane protein